MKTEGPENIFPVKKICKEKLYCELKPYRCGLSSRRNAALPAGANAVRAAGGI
jgi:hypothetical protein